MRIYTEKELADLGYKEVSPGVFARTKPAPSSPAEKKKKVPEQFAKLKAGNYEVGGKTYKFRSGWEYIYAQYLQLLKDQKQVKDWLYECQRFDFPGIKRGCVSYLPDFKVIYPDEHHEWHEVKGYLDKKGATRLKRMAKYYPAEKVILIRKEEIAEIKRSGLVKV